MDIWAEPGRMGGPLVEIRDILDRGEPRWRPWKVKVTQSCPTLWDPMDYTVHGILQARILEWVAIPFSRGPSWPRNQPGSPALQADFLLLLDPNCSYCLFPFLSTSPISFMSRWLWEFSYTEHLWISLCLEVKGSKSWEQTLITTDLFWECVLCSVFSS